MFFEQKFKIFYDNGKIIEVDDLLGYIGDHYGAVNNFYLSMKFSLKVDKTDIWKSSYTSSYDNLHGPNFYLYTTNNVMISPELFQGEYLKQRKSTWWYRNRSYTEKQWKHFRFSSRCYTRTVERNMETFTDRRAVAAVLKEEGEPEFRGKRRNVPNPWNEVMTRRSNNWKNCTKRKKQYKGS